MYIGSSLPFMRGHFATTLVFTLCVAALSQPVFAQSIVADGGSLSTVTIGANGKITVGLAPQIAGSISHNTFSSFSVPGAGVDLDNNSVQADTIINEVTSGNITTLSGALTVIGPQAHVIIANPNGIQVDGGRFVNTGNVALATSSISFDGSNRAIATTTGGSITIGAQGLSGTMEELDLISKALSIAGVVSHDATGATAHTNFIAGQSTVRFDPSFGGGGIIPWALPTAFGISNPNAVVVDITEAGAIRSGRVSITITDQGAGVRHNGIVTAGSQGFRLTSTGQITVGGGQIASDGSVNIKGGSVGLASTAASQAEISSQNSGVTIETSTGSIALGDSEISGKTVSSDNLASSGGVTLISEDDITATSSDSGTSKLTSSGDNIVLIANGAVNLNGTAIEAAGDFRVSADGTVDLSGVSSSVGEDFRLLADDAGTFKDVQITAASDIRMDGASLQFGSQDVSEARTELIATNGGIITRSTSGDITNYGSLIQGNTTSVGDTTSLGGATIISANDLLNRSLSPDRLAVYFGQTDDLNVLVAVDLSNETGRLFSNANVVLNVGGDIQNNTRMSGATTPFTLANGQGGRFASSLWLLREKITTAIADYGTQAIANEFSMILGIGDVTITSTNFSNIGGDVSGRTVTITASDLIDNQTALSGSLSFTQTCRWFCRSSGFSTVRSAGGTITASQDMHLTAGTKIYNLAGQLRAEGDLIMTAPLIESYEIFIPGYFERPAGLLGWFSGNGGWVVQSPKYGQFSTSTGTITFNGSASLGDTIIVSPNDLVHNGLVIERAVIPGASRVGKRAVGLFWNIF